MFCDLIINGFPELIKYFKDLNLNFYFSKPQIKHLQAFMIAMMLQGYNGKMTNVSDLALNTCRTSVCRFLNSKSWNEEYLLQQMHHHVTRRIWEKSKKTGLPIYVVIDDTICEKTLPSSKAERPIYGCSFHKSHLTNKTVYGHQFVTVMLQCGDLVLPYDIILYEKDKNSKIQTAKQVIESLGKPVNEVYVLSDSWYSCQELFEAAHKKGYHFIGALKSNRKVYPKGYRKKGIQVGAFAKTLKQKDFDLVTINGKSYYTYTYLGRINGLRKVKIVISYPKDAMFIPKAMKVFLSTDICMSPKQLLNHYSRRWPIEVFFRESNRHLGMKKCQVHSRKAIIRYQYIVMLCYIFCGLDANGETLKFNIQCSFYRNLIKKYQLLWVYQQAQNNVSLTTIFKEFQIS